MSEEVGNRFFVVDTNKGIVCIDEEGRVYHGGVGVRAVLFRSRKEAERVAEILRNRSSYLWATVREVIIVDKLGL